MARPNLPPGEVRKNVLNIRLTDAERARLDQEARVNGEETSTWARSVLLKAAGGKSAGRRPAK